MILCEDVWVVLEVFVEDGVWCVKVGLVLC